MNFNVDISDPQPEKSRKIGIFIYKSVYLCPHIKKSFFFHIFHTKLHISIKLQKAFLEKSQISLILLKFIVEVYLNK